MYSDKTLSRRHLSCRYEKRYEEAQEGLSRITQEVKKKESEAGEKDEAESKELANFAVRELKMMK